MKRVSKMNNVSKSNTNGVTEHMNTIADLLNSRTDDKRSRDAMRRRLKSRLNERFVNMLKMADGCSECGFVPSSELECRKLDLNHTGEGRIGTYATGCKDKAAGGLSRLVWSGATLDKITDEIDKGTWLCKNCHCDEHAENKELDNEVESVIEKEIMRFLAK